MLLLKARVRHVTNQAGMACLTVCAEVKILCATRFLCNPHSYVSSIHVDQVGHALGVTINLACQNAVRPR